MAGVIMAAVTAVAPGLRISEYSVILEKSVYFPGESVRGRVRLCTTAPIDCRGVRAKMEGIGHSHFFTGSGDDREEHSYTKKYVEYKKTIWGKVYATPVIDNSGENLCYGAPWAPDEGITYMMLEPQERYIVIRIMDYDWGKKDDLLGEVIVTIDEAVDRGNLEFSVTRDGKPEKGKLCARFNWTQNGGVDCLSVCIIGAYGMRSADWLGKNDIYCQLYALPVDKYVAGKAIPAPDQSITLPPTTLDVDFVFTLPKDLPSTMSHGSSYIAYSVCSHIDIAWRLDPCARAFFTVIQPIAAAMYLTPSNQSLAQTRYARAPCVPCCCCCSFPIVCCSKGNITLNCTLDKSGYAVGETIFLVIKNLSFPLACMNTAALYQYITLYAGRTVHRTEMITSVNFTSATDIQVEGGVGYLVQIKIPSIPPTFFKPQFGSELDAFRTIPGGEVRVQNGYNAEPIIWSYLVRLTGAIPDETCACLSTPFEMDIPVTICGLGLSAFSFPSDYVSPQCWYQNQYLMQALPNVMNYTHPEVSPYSPVAIRHHEGQTAVVTFQPSYYVWNDTPSQPIVPQLQLQQIQPVLLEQMQR